VTYIRFSMFALILPSGRLVLVHSRCGLHRTFVRTLSSKAHQPKSTPKPENKAYSNTLLLPKTPFKLQPDGKDIEAKFRKLTCEDLYRWQVWLLFMGYTTNFHVICGQWEKAKGPLFVLHDGPPYANGDLHMGVLRPSLRE
jgi:isoleucyl-tRNA synthetase